MSAVRVRPPTFVQRCLLAGAVTAIAVLAVWFLAANGGRFNLGSFGLGVAGAMAVVSAGVWLTKRQTGTSPRGMRDRMLDHAKHAVITVRPDGVIETFSKGAEFLFGRLASDITGQVAIFALIEEADLSARAVELARENGRETVSNTEAVLGRARSAERHDERVWKCRHANGAVFPARVAVTALSDDDESAVYLLVISDQTAEQPAPSERPDIEAMMAKITSQVPGMVFQMKWAADGRVSMPYVSERVRDILGTEPAVLADGISPLSELVHPEDRGRVHAAFETSVRNLASWQDEFRIVRADGEVRWLWASSLPEKQADGTLLCHGFMADITERKRAERAHEENRALLQSILASIDLAVFLVDVLPGGDFRFVEVNPAYERLTGISAAEIRGRTPLELVPVIPAEMAACLRASLRKGAEAAGLVEYEEPFFVRGRLLWWLTRLTPLRDSAGKVVRLVGRSLDITERKAVELRVQSLTERLQLATEAAQVGIWDYDLVQNKLVCDQRMMVLYGLDPTRFEGTFAAWRERVHPDDRARIDGEYRDAIEGKKPYDTSFRIVRADGEEREICARAHVQRNPAGRAVRVVAVHWDVTAERRAQAEIEFARDQAEDLNRQLEDALERAHRLAQEAAAATVAKSEFLANMSHEIRTPLNAIIGMSGLLLGTDMNKEQREFAETIRMSGDGLLTLVNDILDYSKIESGRLELEHRDFDLRQIIESSVDVLAGRAAEKKLDLVLSIDPSVPESIVGDSTRLRQIAVNLLSNAVKFTSQGEVVFAVNTVPAQDNGRVRLRFSVHDSGIGIPLDRMDRLFKTFSQVDASTTRQYGGTGLGLAISKRIVELMNGRIWAESTAGKGSTFCFEIEVLPTLSPTKPFASGRVPLFAGRRLLIVDDNTVTGRVLCQQAIVWGMIPRAVASLSDARLALSRGERFDVVLVDNGLVGGSSSEATEELQRLNPGRELALALMTLPGQTRVRDHQLVKGAVNKPVKAGALFELLKEVLQGGPVEHAEVGDRSSSILGDRSLRVLLAEDNPVNQRVAMLMLQRLGYRADVAANGREAVDAALRQSYDLILMDVQMPEMDGLQAAREICSRFPPEHRPRIVAMTANASVGDRDRCLSAGMSDFLSKPVRAEDLRRALEETPSRLGAPVG